MTIAPQPSNDRPSHRRSVSPLLVLGYDILAGAASMYASITLRYLLHPAGEPPGAVEWMATGLFTAVCIVIFPILGVNRALWRYTAINDVVRVIQAVLLAHLVFLPIFFIITRLADFPRSSLIISIPLMAAALIVPRIASAAWRSGDLKSLFRTESRDAPFAVLIGEGERIAEVLREQYRRAGGPVFRFRAVIESSGEMAGRALLGVPVIGGPQDLERAVRLARGRGEGPVRIVLADPDPEADLVNLCARVAGRTGASLTRARRGQGASAFTQVEAADLLSRPPRRLARGGARRLLAGKRILVTGAGGTIGGELVRQAARCAPAELILLDAAESHLYEIDMEMRRLEAAPHWSPVLCDIRDEAALRDVFERHRPEVVLHAAALKHVPLMEVNASEAARTNVFGTIAVIEQAIEAGAEAFVLISTDKAVDPTSVMGATKRVAEIFVGARAAEAGSTRLSAVRFGNVLASTGSVVPLFERQIESGGPVTVTHPETTRYFMTVNEAASLVLEAGAQCASGASAQGSLFVLDMGEPVPIARLARQLIRLRGKEPGRDIALEYTGLRPGEKLHESLTYGFERLDASPTEGVLSVTGRSVPLEVLAGQLEALRLAAHARDDAAVRAALESIVALGLPDGVATLGGRLSAGE
ncbi:polysaccharide biosynthesis protein [Marinicauda algicola]|uniref:Polysaccharide biosynthesis protein n=1 Tax=Marinicauda algicola TaxID=2029849 RepID=A0A4S2H1P0_9PROT|nr:polysaccharide biosynthesis protein [Marinicauda algicola]TGY89092.1 polysaccharide biosynthesis protein [Marinicauda algicola]